MDLVLPGVLHVEALTAGEGKERKEKKKKKRKLRLGFPGYSPEKWEGNRAGGLENICADGWVCVDIRKDEGLVERDGW